MKDVSIIIPIYNVEKYVAECLNSVISQTYDHSKIECIIVDDCTPDKSMDIVNDIIGQYKGSMSIRLCRHEKNKGLSASRNTGLDISSGEYIFFLDSDDYLYDNAIETLMKVHAEHHDAEIIIGNTFDEYHNCNLFKLDRMKFFVNMNYLFLGNAWVITATNSLIKKELIDRTDVRFMSGIYFEDNLWNFNLLPNASNVSIISEVTYFYRRNDGGIMLCARKEKVEKCCNDYITILQNFMKNLDYPALVGRSVMAFNMLINTIDYVEKNRNIMDRTTYFERELKSVRKQFLHILLRKKRLFLSLMVLFSFYPLVNLRYIKLYRRHYNVFVALFWKPALVVDKVISFVSR